MLFFFPSVRNESEDNDATPWIESTIPRIGAAITPPFDIIPFLKKKWAERNERKIKKETRCEGKNAETEWKLYQAWRVNCTSLLVFRNCVSSFSGGKRSKKKLGLDYRAFNFFVCSRVLAPPPPRVFRSFHPGWKRRGLHLENEYYQRGSIPDESDVKIARIQRGYKNQVGC